MVVPCGDGHMKVFSLIQQAVTRYRKAIAKVRGWGRGALDGGGRRRGRKGGEGRRRDQYGASWKGEEGDEGGGERESAAAAAASRRPPPRAPGRKVLRAAGPASAAPTTAPGPAPLGGTSPASPRGSGLGAGVVTGAPRAARGVEPNPARGAGAAGRDASYRPQLLQRLKSSPRPLPAPRPGGQSWERELFWWEESLIIPHSPGSGSVSAASTALGPGREGPQRRTLPSCLRGRPRVWGLLVGVSRPRLERRPG